REDLRDLGVEAEAADPRPPPRGHPDRVLKRDPAGRAAQADARAVVEAVAQGRQGSDLGVCPDDGRVWPECPSTRAGRLIALTFKGGGVESAMSERTAMQSPVTGAPVRGIGIRGRLHKLDDRWSPYLYISPFFLLFIVFGLFPLGYTAWVSLTDRTLLDPHPSFIGLDNYTALLHDSYFWNAVENTLGIWVIATIPQLLIALGLATLLNTGLRARTFFRMGVVLPQVTSLVAV